MAELERGILGRHLDYDIKITENEAIVRSVDTGSKKHDIDLYEETKYYDVDDSKNPAYVTIELLDGKSIVVSMNKRELALFKETVDLYIDRRRQQEYFDNHPNVRRGFSIVTMVLFAICAVLALILILVKIF